MIKDIFFTLRILILTAIVALALQARIGEKRVEDNFHNWIKNSVFVDFIQEGIDGGIAVTKAVYKKTDTGIHTMLAKISRRHETSKERGFGVTLKRYNEKEGYLDKANHAQAHEASGH